MIHLPWPRQLVVLGLLGAWLTLLVGGTAIFSLAGTVTTAKEMGQLTRAQRLHQDADMMHDALRTDLESAEEAARRPVPSSEKVDILDATEAHARQFQLDIDGLQAMDLPPVDAKAVASLVPAEERYIAATQRLVGSMSGRGRSTNKPSSVFRSGSTCSRQRRQRPRAYSPTTPPNWSGRRPGMSA